ncbi:hypothetical protein COO60DRAFT_1294064 [Scenedesmus sp. NREL 46B-D3]|nr:hypothetical protein COO60DRAFT_1294064 [Scenedesmus sp. NREL 46B-D3]
MALPDQAACGWSCAAAPVQLSPPPAFAAAGACPVLERLLPGWQPGWYCCCLRGNRAGWQWFAAMYLVRRRCSCGLAPPATVPAALLLCAVAMRTPAAAGRLCGCIVA